MLKKFYQPCVIFKVLGPPWWQIDNGKFRADARHLELDEKPAFHHLFIYLILFATYLGSLSMPASTCLVLEHHNNHISPLLWKTSQPNLSSGWYTVFISLLIMITCPENLSQIFSLKKPFLATKAEGKALVEVTQTRYATSEVPLHAALYHELANPFPGSHIHSNWFQNLYKFIWVQGRLQEIFELVFVLILTTMQNKHLLTRESALFQQNLRLMSTPGQHISLHPLCWYISKYVCLNLLILNNALNPCARRLSVNPR